MTRRRQGRREGADLGSPWHRRGWQMGDDSSDLACAGKVSAVGSVALTKALYLGSGLCHCCNQRLGGGTGRRRAARAKDARGGTLCAKLPHAAHRVFQGLASPFCACRRSSSGRFSRSSHNPAMVMSQKPKFKDARKKSRIPGKCNPTVGRGFPGIFNFTASPWPKVRK